MFKIEHNERREIMAYDYSKLLGKIKEVCRTQAAFGNMMGWSERTTSLKLNNERDWKKSEMDKACTILGIPMEELTIYFFTPVVQN